MPSTLPPVKTDSRIKWLMFNCMVIASGCQSGSGSTVGPSEQQAQQAKSQVIAQGQIIPAGGLIQLSAAPGDIVEQVLVAVGDEVKRGDPLLKLQSESVATTQMETLRLRKEEAVRGQQNAVAQAQQQVAAAELKLSHVESKFGTLSRNAELLNLAEQQVQASQQVLEKLISISSNKVTSQFVGQLEIDRQRIAVREAELAFRQKQEAQLQAEEDLNWQRKAVEQELTAAKAALAAAEASRAIDVLEQEMASLQQQAAGARVVAPTDGMILAVSASPGEASVQLPLVEMANLEKLVCEAEINEMDAALVQPGQSATISSRAFGEQTLKGTVQHKYRLVGRPQLKPLDPLARVDFRTVTATIVLDEQSVAMAREWLQLQVEITIDVTP